MVAVCPSSRVGVAVASYSLRHSQMWSWDVKTLEIIGTQKVKARIELLDISPNGRYCGYYAEAESKGQFYVAICRPPYFQALWIRNVVNFSWRGFVFLGRKLVLFGYSKANENSYGKRIAERMTPGCPLRLVKVEMLHDTQEYSEVTRAQCSKAWMSELNAYQDGPPQSVRNWVGLDACGRKITIRGWGVYADGELILDCTETAFEPIAPPDWAGEW